VWRRGGGGWELSCFEKPLIIEQVVSEWFWMLSSHKFFFTSISTHLTFFSNSDPSHYYEMTDLDDSYWRGSNNNMVSCCRSVEWFVGTPPTVCSTARFPISPSVCGGLALWSC
jgi:hypothetical protein